MDKEEKQEMLKYPSPQPSRAKEIGNLKEIIPPFLVFLSYFLQWNESYCQRKQTFNKKLFWQISVVL